MRIEVEISENLLTREVWAFRAFNHTIVFVSYAYMEKPKGKRTWNAVKMWDKYNSPYQNTCQEPLLPDSIKELAKQKLVEMITVKTWDEWDSSKG